MLCLLQEHSADMATNVAGIKTLDHPYDAIVLGCLIDSHQCNALFAAGALS